MAGMNWFMGLPNFDGCRAASLTNYKDYYFLVIKSAIYLVFIVVVVVLVWFVLVVLIYLVASIYKSEG